MESNSKVFKIVLSLLLIVAVVGLVYWFMGRQDKDDATTETDNSKYYSLVETRGEEAYEILTGSGKSNLQELNDKGYLTAAFFAKEQSSADELLLCGPYDSDVAYTYGTAKNGSTIDLPVTIKFSDATEKTAVTNWVDESGTWMINDVICPATNM